MLQIIRDEIDDIKYQIQFQDGDHDTETIIDAIVKIVDKLDENGGDHPEYRISKKQVDIHLCMSDIWLTIKA